MSEGSEALNTITGEYCGMEKREQRPVDTNNTRDAVISILCGILERDNSLSRCCAVRALGRAQADDPDTLEHLIALLHDPDPDVRLDVAVTLGTLGQTGAVAPLVESLLGDPEGEVRIEAARALAKLRATQAVEPLIRCLREDGLPQLDLSVDDFEFGDSLEVQSQALTALGEIGDCRATAPVVEVLSNPDYEDLQESGFEVLSKLDDRQAEVFLLEQLASSSDSLTRRRAARALAGLAHGESQSGQPGSVILALINALLDVDATVRISAGQALATVDHPVVTVPLTLLLTDLDGQVRAEAADILVRAQAPGVVERLLEMVADADLELKVEITRILGGSGDPKTLPMLRKMLSSGDERLCYQAVNALGTLGLPGVEHDLARILNDPQFHTNTRARVATALGSIIGAAQTQVCERDAIADPAREQTLQALELAVFDRNDAVALAALATLTELVTPQEAMQFLLTLLDGDRAVTEVMPLPTENAAQEADNAESEPLSSSAPIPEPLRELVGEHNAQTSTLAAILTTPHNARPAVPRDAQGGARAAAHSVQVLAAGLLGQRAEPGSSAVPALIGVLEGADTRLIREALAALSRIGDPEAIAPILHCLESDDKDIRLGAIDALAGIGKMQDSPALNEALTRLLDDPQATVREWAVRALAEAGGEMAAKQLPRMLADDHRSVCRRAMVGLTPAMASPELSDQLLANLFRFSAGLRYDAANAIRRLNDFESTPRLLKILSDKGKEELHWICIDALGEIYSSHRSVTH
ncbi:MAG: hypothetical protein CL395_02590 [Acidiferrobacteraceae bacterium]|nr:hypothetical protein [Acidiferrobacteraceae bacterium]